MIGPVNKHNLQYLISNNPDGSRKVKYILPSVYEFIPQEMLRRLELTVPYQVQAIPQKKTPIPFPKSIKSNNP